MTELERSRWINEQRLSSGKRKGMYSYIIYADSQDKTEQPLPLYSGIMAVEWKYCDKY